MDDDQISGSPVFLAQTPGSRLDAAQVPEDWGPLLPDAGSSVYGGGGDMEGYIVTEVHFLVCVCSVVCTQCMRRYGYRSWCDEAIV